MTTAAAFPGPSGSDAGDALRLGVLLGEVILISGLDAGRDVENFLDGVELELKVDFVLASMLRAAFPLPLVDLLRTRRAEGFNDGIAMDRSLARESSVGNGVMSSSQARRLVYFSKKKVIVWYKVVNNLRVCCCVRGCCVCEKSSVRRGLVDCASMSTQQKMKELL